MQEGRHVAKMIRDDHRGLSRTPFRYRDKGIMATIGRSRAVAQSGPLKLTGFVAWIAWLVVHIAFLIGFRHRLFVLLEWFWSYIAWSRGARLVVARPELPGHSAGVDSYAAEPRPSSQDGGANAQGDEGATAGRDDGSDIQPAETPARRVS
jgi:NADH dehydrogenase